MTCIVGIIHGTDVTIAGDSAGTNSALQITSRVDEKVFLNGPYLIGYTSSFRMGQLLRFALRVRKRDPDVSAFEHMVTTFVPAVRSCFTEGGFIWKSEDMVYGGEFLVGYDGHLFHIESDFQVGEARAGYDACGCGADVALGSLYSTAAGTGSVDDRVQMALKAAAEFSAGVRAPFVSLSTAAIIPKVAA